MHGGLGGRGLCCNAVALCVLSLQALRKAMDDACTLVQSLSANIMAMVHTLPKGRQIWSCKYLYLCRGTCFTKGKSHLSNTPAATGHWELWSYALLWLCSKHHGPFHGSHPHHQPRQALPAQDRPANAARMHAPCPPLPGQIQTQAQLLLMQIRRWLSSIRRAAATMASNAWPAHGLSF